MGKCYILCGKERSKSIEIALQNSLAGKDPKANMISLYYLSRIYHLSAFMAFNLHSGGRECPLKLQLRDEFRIDTLSKLFRSMQEDIYIHETISLFLVAYFSVVIETSMVRSHYFEAHCIYLLANTFLEARHRS